MGPLCRPFLPLDPGSLHPFLDLFQGSGSLSLNEGDPMVVGSQAWVSGCCATAVEISSAWQIQEPLGDPLRQGSVVAAAALVAGKVAVPSWWWWRQSVEWWQS